MVIIRYCKFLKDMPDNEGKIIWQKGLEYKVVYEDPELYCFGEPMSTGIGKIYENRVFEIVVRKE